MRYSYRLSERIKVFPDRQPISKQPFEKNISAHAIATSRMHREKSIKHHYDNVLTYWRLVVIGPTCTYKQG